MRDTFYWIALTLPGDAAHDRAQRIADDIVTTEEVLTEYLTFFCASPEYLRREVAGNVEAVLHDRTIRRCALFHRATNRLSRDLSFTNPVRTKATV